VDGKRKGKPLVSLSRFGGGIVVFPGKRDWGVCPAQMGKQEVSPWKQVIGNLHCLQKCGGKETQLELKGKRPFLFSGGWGPSPPGKRNI